MGEMRVPVGQSEHFAAPGIRTWRSSHFEHRTIPMSVVS